MTGWRQELLDLAERLAPAAVEVVTQGLDEAGHWLDAEQVCEVLAPDLAAGVRRPLARLLSSWREARPRRPWSELGVALDVAHQAIRRVRDEQHFELVWTGPDPRPRRLRLTEPVLFELVENAQEDLLLVSYSVSRMEALGAALRSAAERGVRTTLVLEGWEGPEAEAPSLWGWGCDPREFATILIWPPTSRDGGRETSRARLHAKCAVADERDALVTSANLSRPAHRSSIELGIRVTGGALPQQIRQHFRGLEAAGVLEVWGE